MEGNSLKLLIFDLDNTLIKLNCDWDIINKLKKENKNEEALQLELDGVKNSEEIKSTTNFLNKFKFKKKAIFSMNSKEVIIASLKKFNLLDEFSYIISCNDVENKKPNPEGLNKILKYFNISKKEVIYIGDRDIDKLCANALNIKFIFSGEIK